MYALAGKYYEYGVQERISHNNKIGFTDISAPGFGNGISITKRWAPLHRKSNQGRKTHGELFEQLDARVKPGIMTMQFKSIFTECECGMVTTQRAFFMHECIEDLSTDRSHGIILLKMKAHVLCISLLMLEEMRTNLLYFICEITSPFWHTSWVLSQQPPEYLTLCNHRRLGTGTQLGPVPLDEPTHHQL